MHEQNGEVRVFRHLESAQTFMRHQKNASELYGQFQASYEQDPFSESTVALARLVHNAFPIPTDDENLPLADGEFERGVQIGTLLHQRYTEGALLLPNKIVISNAVRAQKTAEAILTGFPPLAEKVKGRPAMMTIDKRVKERSIGPLAEKYSDTAIFFAHHHDILRERLEMGERAKFAFRYPEGESVEDTMLRAQAWDSERMPDERIWVFTHMLFSIAYRLCQEQFTSNDALLRRYLHLLHREPPPTGSMTTYIYNRERGKLALQACNEVLA